MIVERRMDSGMDGVRVAQAVLLLYASIDTVANCSPTTPEILKSIARALTVSLVEAQQPLNRINYYYDDYIDLHTRFGCCCGWRCCCYYCY